MAISAQAIRSTSALLGLLELRSKYEKPVVLSQTAAQARRSRALS
jgi:hypothetical protein